MNEETRQENASPAPGSVPFRDLLDAGGVALFDGAMGTVLYSKGVFIHRAFEELNESQPGLVLDIHRAYAAAGAEVIETNTYGANRFRLSPHGLSGRVEDLNRRGVELAREAADGDAWVAGAMGPLGVRIEPFGPIAREEAREVFAQQARVLLDGGVDLLVLETFDHLPEMEEALAALRELTDLPVVAQLVFEHGGRTREGVSAAEAAERMAAAGADAVGANCCDALAVLEALELMRGTTDLPLAGQPNAGQPRTVDGRSIYLGSPEYLTAWGRRALRHGVRLLGGCCGTTPEHIRALRRILREPRVAIRSERVALPEVRPAGKAPVAREDKSGLARALSSGRFVFGLQVSAPRGWGADEVIGAAHRLGQADGPRFLGLPEVPADGACIPPVALAQLCRDARIDTVVHYSCRGRRLLRMQSDLLGAYATGVSNVLLTTGEPLNPVADRETGPDLEVDSIGAVNLVHRMNHGVDVGGNPVPRPTGFLIGVRLEPGAHDLEREVSRYRWKVDAGAEFAVTVPVFDPDALAALLDRLGPDRVPVIGSLWPLGSSREAEFFEYEMGSVPVPEGVVARMREAEDAGRAEAEGVAIALEVGAAIRPLVQGLQVVVPGGRYAAAWEVLEALVSGV